MRRNVRPKLAKEVRALSGEGQTLHSATGNPDPPVVFPHSLYHYLDITIAFKARELFSPLYQKQAVFGD